MNIFSIKKQLAVTAIFLMLPLVSCAASFDCAKASTETEKMICSNESISRLDTELAGVYKTALAKTDNKEEMKKAQRAWLTLVRDYCNRERNIHDELMSIEIQVRCLEGAYRDRLKEFKLYNEAESPKKVRLPNTATLSDLVKKEFKRPLEFQLVYGDSYPICKPYVDMLNAAKYEEFPACERKILPQFQKFKALEWGEIIDKAEMEKIIRERIDIQYALSGKFDTEHHQFAKEKTIKSLKNNEIALFLSIGDINQNGVPDNIYRIQFKKKNEASLYYFGCETYWYYKIDNKNITLDKAKEIATDPYRMFSSESSNNLFWFDGKIYSSNWNGVYNDEHTEINIYGVANKQICGIKLQ